MKHCHVFISYLTLVLCLTPSWSKAQSCTIIYNDIKTSEEKYISDYKQVLDSLNTIGYYTVKLDSIIKHPCKAYITKGNQYKRIYLKSVTTLPSTDILYDSILEKHYTNDLNQLIIQLKHKLKREGKPFSKISIIPYKYIGQNALIDLHIEESSTRYIDDIKFIGYKKIPSFLKRQLLKKNLVYNDSVIDKIQNQIANYSFLQQTKPPQMSFSNDSTILYLYVEKVSQNSFDGLIGFETDEDNKIQLQGNVDLSLNNALNKNEKINLRWISSAGSSQQLNVSTQFPYLFKSNFGIQSKIDLVKQDSTFTKFGFKNTLLYHLNPNHSIGVHFNYNSSNYIDTNNDANSDFDKNGWGIDYNFSQGNLHKLKEDKIQVAISSSLWNTNYKQIDADDNHQTEIIYHISHQKKIWNDHYLYGKLFGGNLIRDGIKLKNDTYQIGGFKSLRGYNQNSIFTTSYNMGTIAYRFIPNDRIMFELFTDLGFIETLSTDDYEYLQSYGTGMSFLTRFGVFQINYALPYQSINSTLSSGKIHIGIRSYF